MTCSKCHSAESEAPYRHCADCRDKDREYNRKVRGKAYAPSGIQAEKAEKILLGLEISRFHLEPGQSRSFRELARFCECSPQALEDALAQLSEGRREAARIEY